MFHKKIWIVTDFFTLNFSIYPVTDANLACDNLQAFNPFRDSGDISKYPSTKPAYTDTHGSSLSTTLLFLISLRVAFIIRTSTKKINFFNFL